MHLISIFAYKIMIKICYKKIMMYFHVEMAYVPLMAQVAQID